MKISARKRKQAAMLAVLCALMTDSTLAAAAIPDVPDSGSLTREEQERSEGMRPDVEGTAEVTVAEPEQPPLTMADDVKVQVNGFTITGQDIYPEAQLQAMLQEYQGRMVTFKELQAGADKLTAYFRKQGYLMARVYLPAQKISKGIVEYRVVVGRLDEVIIDNKTSIHDSALRREIRFLRPGEYISKAKLERAVWLLTDLAGADAKASMVTGSKDGTVKIKLELTPHYGKCGTFSADNYGNRYTGYNSLGLAYTVLNPEHEGGQLELAGNRSGENLYAYSMRYVLPVGIDGLKASIGYNMLSYRLDDIYSILDACGTSRTFSAGFDYAIKRSQYANLFAGLHYEYSDMIDEYRQVGMGSRKYSQGVVASLYGDNRAGRSITSWRVDYKWGTLGAHDDITAAQERLAATKGTYHKLKLNYQYLQQLSPRVSWILSARGQVASHNLDSSEHFSLGGAYGVRAYPASEASGDMGYLVRGELRYLLPIAGRNRYQLAGFVDHGGVVLERHQTAKGENHRFLQGFGVGLIMSFADDAFLRFDYAWPIGREQSRNDPYHARGHFWLRGGINF